MTTNKTTHGYRGLFGRVQDDGNIAVLFDDDGSVVTRMDVNVYPVGSSLSAKYEHSGGIILSREDAIRIGIEIEID